MTDSRNITEHAMEIFDRVCDLPRNAQKPAIEEACGEDAALRDEVVSLLRFDHGADFNINTVGLGEKLQAIVGTIAADSEAEAPAQIGGYRIIREIGRGGMGVVYEAEQESPKRRVALKVIRSGQLSPNLAKRFEREAFVLGQLQHPGIAHIYESGVISTHGDRQPYFAMELIEGERITAHAANKNLSTRHRLELIARVCDAVQHAHQKAIVHRDLKPANILVLEQQTSGLTGSGSLPPTDVIGQPKILDFGVARIMEDDLQPVTLQTEVGQIVGTLNYMSPEQVAGDANKLDTRCDVYALGVLLFQLLTDRFPIDITGKPVAEAARLINDEDPSLVGSFDRALRGDIETIVAKSLEKNPDRRYPSAAELAADLRRHLQHEPVLARPASTAYQLRKFASRNKGLVAGLAATFVALLAGLIGTATYLVEARAQRDVAEQERNRTENVARFQADLIYSLKSKDFGHDILQEIREEFRESLVAEGLEEQARSRELETLDKVLARIGEANLGRSALSEAFAVRAISEIEDGFTDDLLTEARLRFAVAEMFRHLGMFDKARIQYQVAADAWKSQLGPEYRKSLSSLSMVGEMYREMGMVAEAEKCYREVLEIRRRVLGDSDAKTVGSFGKLGALLRYKGDLKEAEPLLRSAFELTLDLHGPDSTKTMDSKNTYCVLLLDQGKFDEAIKCLSEVLETRTRVMGSDNRRTILARNNLMGAMFRANNLKDAEPIARKILASYQRKVGDDHHRTIMGHNNLGMVLFRLDRMPEALVQFQTAYERSQAHLNPEHEVRIKSTSNLIDTLLELERAIEAEPYCRELLATRRSLKPARPLDVARSLEQFGNCMLAMNCFDDAEPALRECLELREQADGTHWKSHQTRSLLGEAMVGAGAFKAAESLLVAAYKSLDKHVDEIPEYIRESVITNAQARVDKFYASRKKPNVDARCGDLFDVSSSGISE